MAQEVVLTNDASRMQNHHCKVTLGTDMCAFIGYDNRLRPGDIFCPMQWPDKA